MQEVREKDETAEKLFRRALAYHPDHRAYLGLGMIRQRRREFKESREILEEGLRHWPGSEDLTVCLGISHMNLGDFKTALDLFSKVPQSKAAIEFKEECERALKG